MYDWNTTAVADWDQIKDPDVWNAHIAAIQERMVAAGSGGIVGNGSASSVSAGTNIQDATWWNYQLLTSGAPATNVFDAQGDPVHNGSYHLIQTVSPTAATSVTLSPTGNAATVPPNAPPDPATNGNSRKGYWGSDAIAVMKFNVTGGYNYSF